jgi:hypothetical protein
MIRVDLEIDDATESVTRLCRPTAWGLQSTPG